MYSGQRTAPTKNDSHQKRQATKSEATTDCGGHPAIRSPSTRTRSTEYYAQMDPRVRGELEALLDR